MGELGFWLFRIIFESLVFLDDFSEKLLWRLELKCEKIKILRERERTQGNYSGSPIGTFTLFTHHEGISLF